jgi:hypothetical protein
MPKKLSVRLGNRPLRRTTGQGQKLLRMDTELATAVGSDSNPVGLVEEESSRL